MRVTYTLGKMTFGQDVKNVAEGFEFIAGLMDIFSGEPCGCCGSKETHPEIRHYQGKAFRKMVCEKCTASIMLFARDDGGMWYVRTNREKQPLPNKGWSVYRRDGQAAPRRQEPDLPPNESQADPDGTVPF